jgi:hypothetical protein
LLSFPSCDVLEANFGPLNGVAGLLFAARCHPISPGDVPWQPAD